MNDTSVFSKTPATWFTGTLQKTLLFEGSKSERSGYLFVLSEPISLGGLQINCATVAFGDDSVAHLASIEERVGQQLKVFGVVDIIRGHARLRPESYPMNSMSFSVADIKICL